MRGNNTHTPIYIYTIKCHFFVQRAIQCRVVEVSSRSRCWRYLWSVLHRAWARETQTCVIKLFRKLFFFFKKHFISSHVNSFCFHTITVKYKIMQIHSIFVFPGLLHILNYMYLMVSILRTIICTLSACCRIKFATHWMHARIQKTFQGQWIRRIIVFAQGIFSIILICKFNKFNKFSFFMGWGGGSGPPTSSLDPRMGWCISFVKFIFLFFYTLVLA